MRADRPTYDALLESVVDGSAVDWRAVESTLSNDRERSRIRNLRLVARVADLQRTLSDLEETSDTTDTTWSDDETEPAPAAWGHLVIGTALGHGAFSDVYRAHDPQLDVDVALKILRPDPNETDQEARLREPRALARLRHPNVVSVHGASIREGRVGWWMELVEGRTLNEELATRRRMSPNEAVDVGIELCRALEAVHGGNLVHGDVKTQNVIREARTGRIVLMDFGAGRRISDTTATVTGTPLYAAPEVLAGTPPTPASDLYSTAVLLYHLMTGRYPFEASTLGELRRAHAEGRRLRLREASSRVPAPIAEVIEHGLNNDPARRYSSAAAMEQALRNAVRNRTPFASYSPAVVGVAAVLAALLLTGIVDVRSSLPGAGAGPLKKLAVMPFGAPQGGDLAPLASGLSSDLVRELQKYDLSVVKLARDTAPVLPAAIADESAIRVTGTMTQDGQLTSVRVSLSDPTRRVAWAHTYAVWKNKLPRLTAAIAGDIGKAMAAQRTIGSGPPQHIPTPEAYQAYITGRSRWSERTIEGMKAGSVYFAQAVAYDPEYAEAYAGQSDAYLTQGINAFGGFTPRQARLLAKKPAQTALRLNPNLAEAHTSLAFASYFQDWDWTTAEEGFNRAISLDPDYAQAHAWYSDYLTAMGRFDAAAQEMQKALDLEPASVIFQRDVAWSLFMRGDFDAAIEWLTKVLTLDPSYTPTRTLLARALTEKGRYQEAMDLLDSPLTNMPRVSRLAFIAYIQAASGDGDAARATLRDLDKRGKDEVLAPYFVALVHNALRDRGRALDWLHKALREEDPQMVNVRSDPRLGNLRTDPEFLAILKEMKFPPY